MHWHYIRDKALETLKRQAEREGGRILILPSDNSKEAGGLSSRTLDLSSKCKGSDLFGNEQGSGKVLLMVRQTTPRRRRGAARTR